MEPLLPGRARRFAACHKRLERKGSGSDLQRFFDAIAEGVSARAAELLDQEGTKERENQKDYSNFDKRDHRIGRSDKSVGIAADPHLRCSLTQDQCLPIMNPQIVWGGHKRDEIYPMASNPRKGTW